MIKMLKIRYHYAMRGFALLAKSQIRVLMILKTLMISFYLSFFVFLICSTLIPPNPISLGSIDSKQTTIRSFALPYLVESSSVMSAISCSFCALSNSGLANFIVTSGILRPLCFFVFKVKMCVLYLKKIGFLYLCLKVPI